MYSDMVHEWGELYRIVTSELSERLVCRRGWVLFVRYEYGDNFLLSRDGYCSFLNNNKIL